MLLLRSVADVESSRLGRVRPSFTSRDIAALPELGPEPRAAFSLIAGVVEAPCSAADPSTPRPGRPAERLTTL